jgi:hypothetical protein
VLRPFAAVSSVHASGRPISRAAFARNYRVFCFITVAARINFELSGELRAD